MIAARLGTAIAVPPARRRKSRRLIGCCRRPGAIGTVASSCAGAGLTGDSGYDGEYHSGPTRCKVAGGRHGVHPSPVDTVRRVVVVGAGLAGLAAARIL